MIWDGLIFLAVIGFAVAGWKVGVINSWRGPLSMVIATVVVQRYYVDFATWIVQQAHISAVTAVALGYMLLWLSLEMSSELVLNAFIRWGTKRRPCVYERIAGAMIGVAKVLVFVLFPIMAIQAEITVPEPPKEVCSLEIPMPSGLEESRIIARLTPVAKNLMPTLGLMVVCQQQPSFEPVFNTRKYNLNPDLMDFKAR